MAAQTKLANGKAVAKGIEGKKEFKEFNGVREAKDTPKSGEEFEETPIYLAIAGYISYAFIFFVGYIREAIWGIGPVDGSKIFRDANENQGYAPLFANFESFYTRNMFRRQKDIFAKPIASVPGAKVTVINHYSDDHGWTLKRNDKDKRECVNLASYNYLGFAENKGPCTEASVCAIQRNGLTGCSTRQELGTMGIHQELECTVAKFLGVEDSLIVGMGFATNVMNIPQIMGKGTLIISDEKNHASLILGMRLSGATVKVFNHNNVESLEKILRKSIIHGHPRTRRPWKKILIVVEGVYSMEGSIVKLPEIVAIKKKYGAYLYLDEAHSVGAMGPNGRGVVDYYELNPRDIDIMMGTFTKSFGSAGGYIAGSKALISHLRVHSQSCVYPTSMSPPVAKQIIASMNAIMDTKRGDGMSRIRTLARNSRYFRRKLQEMGCIVYGHDDSPVVPMMIFVPAKLLPLINGLLERNVASVGVGFPATNIAEERVRFCISAGHTQEMLDSALDAIDEMANYTNIKYSRKRTQEEIVY